MKRAVLLCIAAATILLLVLSSAPLQAGSQTKSGSYPGVVAPATGPGAPGVQGGNGGGGGGGTDEGDADGLSGIKDLPPRVTGSAERDVKRNWIFLELWWKFMVLWAR
jgi:hypothetical protein